LRENIEYTPVNTVPDALFPLLLRKIQEGLNGNEAAGDIFLHGKDLIFFTGSQLQSLKTGGKVSR
jgi:hypothetical protein